MSRRLRWAVGAALGVMVGLAGVAIYNSGGSYRCGFAIPDADDRRLWGLSYATEICDRAERGLPRTPEPAPLAPGGSVYWSKKSGVWRTNLRQPSGLYTWTHDPGVHAWRRGERLPTAGSTRSETWALRRDELLREHNRLLAEQNRLLAGLPPTPPEPTVLPASGVPSNVAEAGAVAGIATTGRTPFSRRPERWIPTG